MDFEKLIDNIIVFNSIVYNDKLCIFDGRLTIQESSIYRPLYRYYYSQTREKTHLFLINMIKNMSDELCKFTFLLNNKSKYKIKNLNIKNLQEYNYYLSEYLKLKNSVEILAETYKLDKTFKKKMMLNINLIDDYNPKNRWINLF